MSKEAKQVPLRVFSTFPETDATAVASISLRVQYLKLFMNSESDVERAQLFAMMSSFWTVVASGIPELYNLPDPIKRRTDITFFLLADRLYGTPVEELSAAEAELLQSEVALPKHTVADIMKERLSDDETLLMVMNILAEQINDLMTNGKE